MLVCFIVLAATAAFAQEAPDDEAITSVPVLTALSPHGVVVFTGDELLRRGHRTLGEALADVAGVVRDRTTLGPRYGLRGVPDGMALVVDGVPQVQDGERELLDVDDGLNLADVERVEILRGPAAAMNGIGALTGVVRVTTRRPGLDAATVRLGGALHPSLQDGDRPFVETEAAADASWRQGSIGARASVLWRRGPAQRWALQRVPTRFQSIDGTLVLPTTKQNLSVLPADDDALLARGTASLDDVTIDASYAGTTIVSPLSSFSHGLVVDDPERRRRDALRLRVLWQRHIGPVHVEAAVVGARTTRTDHVPLYPPAGAFPAGGALDVSVGATTGGVLVRADVPIVRDHRVVVGAFGDVTRTRAQTDAIDPVDGTPTPRLVEANELAATGSAALEYQGDFGWGLHATAGLVGSWRTAFPPALAPRVALTWVPISSLSLTTSYAEGTRTPDRYDMVALAQAVVGQSVVGAQPNLDLRPERVRVLEADVGYSPSAGLHLDASLYGLRHEDALANVADGALLVPVNLAPRHVVGAEVSGRVDAVPGFLQIGSQAAFASTIPIGGVGTDLGVDGAQIAADFVVTPLDGLECGSRARLLFRPGADAAAGAYPTADVFASYEPMPALRIVAALRDALGRDAPSRDFVELPTASDVAVPGADRSLYLAVEGRL